MSSNDVPQHTALKTEIIRVVCISTIFICPLHSDLYFVLQATSIVLFDYVWGVFVSPYPSLRELRTQSVGSMQECRKWHFRGEIEFCIDIENTYKNTQFKLYTKSQLKLMTILEQK